MESERDLAPLVIGVSGHRDLRDEDIKKLEDAVRSFFQETKAKCAHTPIIVLSALAEGADRLVAKVALEEGAKLVAPLPLPIDEYVKDFQGSSSKEEFEALLAKADSYFVMPLAEGNDNENIKVRGEPRNKQYAMVGAYIATHCNILMALWDGVYSGKTGGTGDVVKYRQEGVPEFYSTPCSKLECVGSGVVYHIITPHKKNPNPEGEPFSLKKIYPPEVEDKTKGQDKSLIKRLFLWWKMGEKHQETKSLKLMDCFNKELQKLGDKLANDIERSISYLMPKEELEKASYMEKRKYHKYAMADSLAIYFKSKRNRVIFFIYIFILLGFGFFLTYERVLEDSFIAKNILSLYPICIGLGFLFFLLGKKGRYQDKHLDYRALAEGMRVQIYWDKIESDRDVADFYLLKHRGELEWVRMTIRGWNIPLGMKGEPLWRKNKLINPENLKLVYDCWVQDQKKFFDKNIRKFKKKIFQFRVSATIAFLLAFILAMLLFYFHSELMHNSFFYLRRGMGVGIGFFLATAAVIEGILDKLVYTEQLKHYIETFNIYNIALNKLDKFKNLLSNFSSLNDKERKIISHQIWDLIVDLGREALTENGDWVVLHRTHPLEFPLGI